MTVEENLLMGGYIKEKTEESFEEAEKILKLRCPMDNEFKVGITWADTH